MIVNQYLRLFPLNQQGGGAFCFIGSLLLNHKAEGMKMHRILLSLLILGCVIYLTACNSLGILQSTPSPAEREAEECAVDITILEGSKERCMHNLTVAAGTESGPC